MPKTDTPREYRYEINGKTYIQRALVLGQIPQMQDVLRGISFPDSIDPAGMLGLLDTKLPEALAVVLTEEGTSPKDKDVAAQAEEFRNTVDLSTAMDAIDHFFGLNPVASISQRLVQMIAGLRAEMTRESGSKTSSSSSPEGTSPGGRR